jgi:hypothetical protein
VASDDASGGRRRTLGERREAVAARVVPRLREILRDGRAQRTGTYLALSELVGREALPPGEGADLTRYELRVFSQNGEDGVIAEIMKRVGTASRSFVEFGVETGAEGNCVFLADVLGWSGLFAEADDRCHAALERKYADSGRVGTLHARITPGNVEQLFAEAGVPDEPDVLAIDVDGTDYWIWEAIERVRPRLVVIEYNGALPSASRLVQPPEWGGWDGTDYYGASSGALRALGERKGYRTVHAELSGSNLFLVRGDLPWTELPGAVLHRPPSYDLHGARHRPRPPERRFIDLDAADG